MDRIWIALDFSIDQSGRNHPLIKNIVELDFNLYVQGKNRLTRAFLPPHPQPRPADKLAISVKLTCGAGLFLKAGWA
jgi:hypothetical protein